MKWALSRGAHEQQIWEVILREILNLSWNAKICISENKAMFLEMQIFALRDRLRISPKTTEGIRVNFLIFFLVFQIDFSHINDPNANKAMIYTKNIVSLKMISTNHFNFFPEHDLTVEIASLWAP